MIYFSIEKQPLEVQEINNLYVCYMNNTVFIPRSLDIKYKISEYFLKNFKLSNLYQIEDNKFNKIKYIKINLL